MHPLTKKIQDFKETRLSQGQAPAKPEKRGPSYYDPDNFVQYFDNQGVERIASKKILLPVPQDLLKYGVDTWFGIIPMRWVYETSKLGPNYLVAAMAIVAQVYAHRFPKSQKNVDGRKMVRANHHTIVLAGKYWKAVKPHVMKNRAKYVRGLAEAHLLSAEIRKGRSIKVTIYVDAHWFGDTEEYLDTVVEPVPLMGD